MVWYLGLKWTCKWTVSYSATTALFQFCPWYKDTTSTKIHGLNWERVTGDPIERILKLRISLTIIHFPTVRCTIYALLQSWKTMTLCKLFFSTFACSRIFIWINFHKVFFSLHEIVLPCGKSKNYLLMRITSYTVYWTKVFIVMGYNNILRKES